ncbi:unnamed protein product [Polarella glacialis]|uniref:Uncharacterized protein n=1 Tax=Polarella glacialis TaxID=89957 RepID=A0A813K3W7_POLGL|nr:unnamed protein product [Polarella glacialis]CAE8632553.1 unnamed protein product [Polarella glacialis]CAE8693176.1 unnamed protein product [Polarella glacialis]CAE8738406.1 unnamed protein product [Polarella glacialis]|mmetsp:Transcript_30337/g.48600  ORF Transcript_30337/g.48600 Transcript_30337/m.48600 type:complete len:132 (+) Transcript_30337:674-1069(+)
MIAPGSPDQLNNFLNQLPEIPRDKVFVDDSKGYEAYKAMSFGKLEFGKPLPPGLSLQAPDLGGISGVLSYLSSVVSLSPKPEEGATTVPEGVLLLGGTFVMRNEEVVYAWADRLPGDYPKPQDVFSTLEGC